MVAAAVGVGIWLVIQLKLLVIPLLIAVLITALLWPTFAWMLRRAGAAAGSPIVIVVVGALAIVTRTAAGSRSWQITQQWLLRAGQHGGMPSSSSASTSSTARSI